MTRPDPDQVPGRAVPGFEVYDRAEVRRRLDDRLGAVIQLSDGWLRLSRRALEMLESVSGPLQHRGVLLAYNSLGCRLAILGAPVECPREKRQDLLVLHSFHQTGPLVTDDWPAAVQARDFLTLHGIGQNTGPCPVDLVHGMLVVNASSFVTA